MKATHAIFDSAGTFSRFEEIDPAELPPIPAAADGLPRAVPVTQEPLAPKGKAHAYSRAGWVEVDIPEVPVPTNLPAWRIRAVLRKRGLLTSVKALLAQLPADVRAVAEEQINDSRFERDHQLIGQLGAALNLTSKDLDDIFREADALV